MDLSVKLIRLALVGSLSVAFAAPALATSAANLTAVNNGIAYVSSQQQADGQIAGFPGINSWALMAYTANGASNAGLRAYLQNHAPAAGATAAEWERDILAITADGQNPYNFGGTNYVNGLKALHTGGQIGVASADNDDAYGILALVAAHVAASDSALTDAVTTVLAHQHADGGFSYSTDSAAASDVDDTAAFVSALRAAQSAGVANAGLSGAITSAETFMLSKQNADGGFLSDPAWGTDSNVSSTSVALIALNTLGLGSSAQALNAANYLKSTQQADGSFPYQLPVAQGQTGDTFDSVYAIAALAGGTWPQKVYAGEVPAPTATPVPTATPLATITPTTTPDPATGSVLGASTSTLPAVGTFMNQILLAIAAVIALSAGWFVYRRQQRSKA